jgi:hypothetical protein
VRNSELPASSRVSSGPNTSRPKVGSATNAETVSCSSYERVCPNGGEERLLADRGYSHTRCRGPLRRRAIPYTVPNRKDRKERRPELDGDPAPGPERPAGNQGYFIVQSRRHEPPPYCLVRRAQSRSSWFGVLGQPEQGGYEGCE